MVCQYEHGIILYYMCVLVTVHFTVHQFFMFRLNVRGLSVCVDGWFILGAMIALHHRCAASPSPESNQSDLGLLRL